MTDTKNWALIWTTNGHGYLADISSPGFQPRDFKEEFLEKVREGLVCIGREGAFEYQNPISMTQQGTLTRQTLVVPVDAILKNTPIYVMVCEVVFFSDMDPSDLEHFTKIVESGEKTRQRARDARSPIKVIGS